VYIVVVVKTWYKKTVSKT